MEVPNGCCGVLFYIPQAPASCNSAAMLEAGEILEENPQSNWKISGDVANPVFVRGTPYGGFANENVTKTKYIDHEKQQNLNKHE